MPRVEALCVSHRKGQRKSPVNSAVFLTGRGIEGDAHAGSWHRQVSMLSADDIETVRQEGLTDLAPGAFAENVIVWGLDFASFGLGTRLRLGTEVVLVITQIGKECHSPCRIYRLTGECIMPRLGLFARVVVGGEVRVGDPVEVLQVVPRDRSQTVVPKAGERRSSGETSDTEA